jgi:hypothetical protein
VSATYSKSLLASNAKPEGDLKSPSPDPKEPNSKENDRANAKPGDTSNSPKIIKLYVLKGFFKEKYCLSLDSCDKLKVTIILPKNNFKSLIGIYENVTHTKNCQVKVG